MTSTHRIFVGKDVHKFSCAHMTVFPDGSKERLHGHNFQVEVAIELKTIAFHEILDFAIVKKAIQAQCDSWTERLLLAGQNPHYKELRNDEHELEFLLCGKRYVVPRPEVLILNVDNIVVETLSAVFAEQLVARLGENLRPEVVSTLEVTISESSRQGSTARVVLGS
jgi:6-pyruvoyltetrahydropterin/6-carboxytetrahydropterin synthase